MTEVDGDNTWWNQQRGDCVEVCKPNCVNISTTLLRLFGPCFSCKLDSILLGSFRTELCAC